MAAVFATGARAIAQIPGAVVAVATGSFAVTEGADVAAFTGIVVVQGTLAATEGADSAAFTGNVVALVVEAPNPGGRIVGGHFSRGRWRNLKKERDELEDVRRAQQDAEERVHGLKRAKQRKAIAEAAQVAAQVIAAAEASEQELQLGQLTRALNAATGADTVKDTIAKANLAIQIAREILRRAEDEEEEEAIMILLAS